MWGTVSAVTILALLLSLQRNGWTANPAGCSLTLHSFVHDLYPPFALRYYNITLTRDLTGVVHITSGMWDSRHGGGRLDVFRWDTQHPHLSCSKYVCAVGDVHSRRREGDLGPFLLPPEFRPPPFRREPIPAHGPVRLVDISATPLHPHITIDETGLLIMWMHEDGLKHYSIVDHVFYYTGDPRTVPCRQSEYHFNHTVLLMR